jgi:hypothetical protein
MTSEQRRVLGSIATHGVTPLGTSERTYMGLVRRLVLGSTDRLPNGEGGVHAITEAGCRALSISTHDAIRVGHPLPYWVDRS